MTEKKIKGIRKYRIPFFIIPVKASGSHIPSFDSSLCTDSVKASSVNISV